MALVLALALVLAVGVIVLLLQQHSGSHAGAAVPGGTGTSDISPAATESNPNSSATQDTRPATSQTAQPATSHVVMSRPSTSSATTPATPAATATPTSEAQALTWLNEERGKDQATLPPHDNRWVVQLSSKKDGGTDPVETTRTGSHTWHYADIWLQYLELQQRVAQHDKSVPVALVSSADFGEQRSGGPWWTVVAFPHGVQDKSSGLDACQRLVGYPNQQALANGCLPRQWSTPH